jgi:AcrR family transcriptional regulator
VVGESRSADNRTRPAVTRHQGNRYGRSESARAAILEAADDLLVERGFAGVTMEGIAARAGVAKQTIYRWWNNKADVLLDAFVQDMAEELVEVDEGDLERDLRAYLRLLAAFLREPETGATFRALVGNGHLDAAFGERFNAQYVDVQRQRHRRMVQRAVERKELPTDLDVDAETDQLIGPLYYRALVTREPLDDGFVDRLVDSFLERVRARRK